MAWAEPFCSGDLVTMTDDDLEAMLLGSGKVKGIQGYPAATIRHALEKRRQMRAPLVRNTEAVGVDAASIVALCAQTTDYQALNADTLMALAQWTNTAHVEHSLAPLQNSGMTRREWERTLRTAFPREKWPEDAAFGSLADSPAGSPKDERSLTGQKLRFIVRRKGVHRAREWHALFGGYWRRANWIPEG